MKQRDRDRVEHILKATDEILEMNANREKMELEKDIIIRRAVERNIVIIGEAANSLSDTFKQNHSDIPWSDIVNMRNIIVHDYDDIALDVLKDTMENDIPDLKEVLEKVLADN